MFLAGLEIDLSDFKKNKWKSMAFAGFTFAFPFALGFSGPVYVLDLPLLASILFASLLSSPTLIVYLLISKLAISRTLSVTLTDGGKMITYVLSLLVLASFVGLTPDGVNPSFLIDR